MTSAYLPATALAVAATIAMLAAVVLERRMQRHRRAGVSYRDVTLRRDGGWRREDLFTPEGLALQRRAARWAAIGVALWLAALAAFIAES